ncbi:SDR family oxidoreductase [Flavobacteriales bacterium]|jgi:NAD(P)-dependent dehydrogenase (short-subunit alcohol dehydrogenase family)|nr:SDR family oxidoreductase [Flavobacteriales bacterium]MDB4195765.1 SDR family oxidoreductase [Flavobacteriales bacterium]MDB4195774.1 SDR family oxidoreductase [Flavobacteriales bacterium]MDB9702227.1 SDR family oxidoreductase [Flavobacteriales bacterium]|tara:strand:- start:1168 stop:1929 length:762 start_codon:yes stop_codon:yes gene_type:complete
MSSKGRVVIVTGATSGIGFEVAKRLGKDGYTVILNGLDDKLGAECVSALEAEGLAAEYSGFDVTNEDAVNSAVKAIGDKHGKIDVIVNNAGGLGGRSRFEEMTTEFYRKVMALNLDSVFFVSRAAIPYLKKGENANIINYTSNAGWNAGGPGAGIYGTSKAGVHAITRALAKDLAVDGIRVNAVSPGTIDTPFHAQIKSTKPEVFASWKNNIMLGRLGQPEEVAAVVSFLAGKDASFITAETIQVGGGQALGI